MVLWLSVLGGVDPVVFHVVNGVTNRVTLRPGERMIYGLAQGEMLSAKRAALKCVNGACHAGRGIVV